MNKAQVQHLLVLGRQALNREMQFPLGFVAEGYLSGSRRASSSRVASTCSMGTDARRNARR